MIKVDVISGFLGAGKTTLIKKMYAKAFANETVVLIENEFGQVGVDGAFLKEAGIQIKEINSGCICCTLVGDFNRSLQEIIERFAPDRIIIEPSGVGKLSDIIDSIHKFGDALALNVVATVVDAGKCKMYMRNFGEFYQDQIKQANTVVLSKGDVCGDAKLAAAVELVRSLNSRANIVTTSVGQLEGARLLEVLEGDVNLMDSLLDEVRQAAEEHRHHHHHHHHEDGEECRCHHHHNEDEDEDEHEDHDEDDDECCCHHHHHDDETEDDEDEECCCHHHHNEDEDEDEHEDHDEDEDEEEHHHHHEGEECHHHHHDDEDEDDDDDECCCHHHDDENEDDDDDECCYHHHHHDDEDEDEQHHHHHEDEHHHHHGHDADEVFDSWGKETTQAYSREQLDGILAALCGEDYGVVLRAKGIVAAKDCDQWYYFDLVAGDYEIRTGAPDVVGRLCVIGAHLPQEKLAALFAL